MYQAKRTRWVTTAAMGLVLSTSITVGAQDRPSVDREGGGLGLLATAARVIASVLTAVAIDTPRASGQWAGDPRAGLEQCTPDTMRDATPHVAADPNGAESDCFVPWTPWTGKELPGPGSTDQSQR